MKVNGITIHSNYSPEKEAFKFLDKQNISGGFHIFIIVGGGKGYLEKAVKTKFPKCKVIVFFLDKSFSSFNSKKNNNYWYPGDEILPFLGKQIHDYLLNKVILLNWYPCSKAFPDIFNKVLSSIKIYLERRNASIITTMKFGKNWIRNCVLNFTNTRNFFLLKAINRPIVITASGPSLILSLDLLKEYRSKYVLFSLPSSLSALKAHDIKPDLIISTDAGYWNTRHFTNMGNNSIPVASPLTASYNKLSNPVILLNQSSFIEEYIIKAAELHSLKIPPNGTVAGTALMVALDTTKYPIIFAGLDFAYKDLHEHVKPHTFDQLFESMQNRLKPLISIIFSRKYDQIISGKKNSRAFDTYASWFGNFNNYDNLYHLNPVHVQLNGFISINNSKLKDILISSKGANKQLFFMKTSFKFGEEKGVLINNVMQNLILLVNNFKLSITKDINLSDLISFFTENPLILEIIEFTEYRELLLLINNIPLDANISKNKLVDLLNSVEFFLKGFIK